MRLALFDLDHTLIPFDSTMVWLRYLVETGEVDAGRDAAYLDCCRQYVAGELDVAGLHACALVPLSRREMAEVGDWQARFARDCLTAEVPEAARRLIERHHARGDTCCIVTNTTDIVAEPFARALGVPHLIASRIRREGECLTGDIDGEPCHGFGKVRLVSGWLAGQGQSWDRLEWSGFYSDSISDLPLLSFVREPVAVAPDAALRAHAGREGWRVVETLADA